jgi:triosephosphate isomerase
VKQLPRRTPLALANWKMAMTVSESLSFARAFLDETGHVTGSVDVVLCPPYTCLYMLARELDDTPVHVGGQNVCAATGEAHTGEVSAPLLVDAGARWAMVGHWEVRRERKETDEEVSKKMQACFQAGLCPVLFIGEERSERGGADEAMAARLPNLFAGCRPEQVAKGALLYEPEWSIGQKEPASLGYVSARCAFLRDWIRRAFGRDVAEEVRIIYGGSVSPTHTEGLLSSPDVDGLGAGRAGRDPALFGEIVRRIAAVKGLG